MDFSFCYQMQKVERRKKLLLHQINKKMKNKTNSFLLQIPFMSNPSEIFDLLKKLLKLNNKVYGNILFLFQPEFSDFRSIFLNALKKPKQQNATIFLKLF